MKYLKDWEDIRAHYDTLIERISDINGNCKGIIVIKNDLFGWIIFLPNNLPLKSSTLFQTVNIAKASCLERLLAHGFIYKPNIISMM